MPRPIVLVGLMGVGKTTVGRALAESIGYRFIDNDAGIEAEYDATGAELAERLGVDGLHRLEAAQLANALGSFGAEPIVIAAAASVVEDEASRSLLDDHPVVWLDASPAYLADRLGRDHHRRSLGPDPQDALSRQSEERRGPFAAIADVTVAVEGRSRQSIVEEIVHRLTSTATPPTDE
ncbi:MAG: AAA family ATPase [Acidimicrobiia bacterium]|nr:AAA family ATPase [Acidimicrobiia bacterium]MBT8191794.1 AAA family ATPase [Acidimicrobiia bacterium]MBT8246385.1 AAA family ATPase [Acidimicrobiia bacterium]NNF87395.1 AAA family ATPase [Acidimicrobiia bacterium]NNJ47652.1 AAA family ATPase [Acidimicrobiia bacterium]